jgi:hypothetical protein
MGTGSAVVSPFAQQGSRSEIQPAVSRLTCCSIGLAAAFDEWWKARRNGGKGGIATMNGIFALPGIATYSLAIDLAWLSALAAGFFLGRLEVAPTAKSGTFVIGGTTLFLVVLKLIHLHTSPGATVPGPFPSVILLVTAGFGLAHAVGSLTSRNVQAP